MLFVPWVGTGRSAIGAREDSESSNGWYYGCLLFYSESIAKDAWKSLGVESFACICLSTPERYSTQPSLIVFVK